MTLAALVGVAKKRNMGIKSFKQHVTDNQRCWNGKILILSPTQGYLPYHWNANTCMSIERKITVLSQF